MSAPRPGPPHPVGGGALTRIGVVVNPTAGKGRGRAAGQRTIAALSAAGHDVVDLTAPNHPLALESARAATRGEDPTGTIDALVVVGGDGMVHLGVNAVADTGMPLGIVAVGTGNDFAHAVGLPTTKATHAIDGLLDALGSPPVTVDAAHVTGDHLHEPHWFAGVLSAGLDAAVNAHANAIAWPRGRSRYARSAFTEITRFRPYGYRITLTGTDESASADTVAGVPLQRAGEDVVWESPGTLVAVANGGRIGGGIRIAPDARLDDGLLDVVVAGPFSRWGAARIFPGTYRGSHVGHPRVGVMRARVVTVEPAGVGAVPPAAFADGEHVGVLPVRVEVRPGVLRVLAPGSAVAGGSGSG